MDGRFDVKRVFRPAYSFAVRRNNTFEFTALFQVGSPPGEQLLEAARVDHAHHAVDGVVRGDTAGQAQDLPQKVDIVRSSPTILRR
jgi:hypothetical protein